MVYTDSCHSTGRITCPTHSNLAAYRSKVRLFLLFRPQGWHKTHTLDTQKGHNFFDPQPAWDDDDSECVSVFLVCNVLHNWADENCLTILKHLRAGAGPTTRLIIVDLVITSVCDEPATHEIPGAQLPVPPFPLLRNLGYACSHSYLLDSQVRRLKCKSTRLMTSFCTLPTKKR